MIRLLIRYLYVLVVIVLVASCSSTRKLEKTPMIGGLTGEAYMEKVIELSPSWKAVSGKVALTLNMEGQKDTKVSATLRLKRGESIQLYVAPLLGIEVARLEITPEGLLAVDRLNKRYVKVSFEELSRLANTELSFNVLQFLFLNELFLPGKAQLDVSDAKSFRISLEMDVPCWKQSLPKGFPIVSALLPTVACWKKVVLEFRILLMHLTGNTMILRRWTIVCFPVTCCFL